jgi:DnaK suppressor protein
MSKLEPPDIVHFEQRLRRRQDYLRREIAGALADTGREDFTEIVGRVRDPGEESVAELIASTHLAVLARDTDELRRVEAALRRIRERTYGRCQECGARSAANGSRPLRRPRAASTASNATKCGVRPGAISRRARDRRGATRAGGGRLPAASARFAKKKRPATPGVRNTEALRLRGPAAASRANTA